MVASVSIKSAPVRKCGNRFRNNLIMISVPPVVAPHLNTHPKETATKEPPAMAANKVSCVAAPRGANIFVKNEVNITQ